MESVELLGMHLEGNKQIFPPSQSNHYSQIIFSVIVHFPVSSFFFFFLLSTDIVFTVPENTSGHLSGYLVQLILLFPQSAEGLELRLDWDRLVYALPSAGLHETSWLVSIWVSKQKGGSGIPLEQAVLSTRPPITREQRDHVGGGLQPCRGEAQSREHNKSQRGGRLVQKWTVGTDWKEPKAPSSFIPNSSGLLGWAPHGPMFFFHSFNCIYWGGIG